MLTEQLNIIENVFWIAFSDDIIIEKDKNYVFKIDVDNYFTQIVNHYPNVLSHDELKKAAFYKFENDKKRFVSGKYFLRIVLSKISLINPPDIEFQYSEYKKPFLNNIKFNLSHSGKYILIAISTHDVGIDVEFVDRTVDNGSLLNNAFSLNEVQHIENNIDETLSFYALWTRKEAILKATGEGLTDELGNVSCLNNIEKRNQINFHLTSFKIDNDYIACIAAAINNKNIYITI